MCSRVRWLCGDIVPANSFHRFFWGKKQKQKLGVCYGLDAVLDDGGIKMNRTDRNLACVCVREWETETQERHNSCYSIGFHCISTYFFHLIPSLGNWDVHFHLIDLQRILALGCSRSKNQLPDRKLVLLMVLCCLGTHDADLWQFHKEEGSEMPNSLKFRIDILASVPLELFGNKCKTNNFYSGSGIPLWP